MDGIWKPWTSVQGGLAMPKEKGGSLFGSGFSALLQRYRAG